MPVDHQNFRLRGIPCEYESRADVRDLVRTILSIESGASFAVHSLAVSPVEQSSKVATLSFHILPQGLSDKSRNEWVYNLPMNSSPGDFSQGKSVVFDTHFSGFTPLQYAKDDDCHMDIISLSGLGGHAFGSFKERKGLFMWLRDALPLDFPYARVLIYGYDTQLPQSHSFQTLTDLGRALRIDTKGIRKLNQHRPIIFIGHSLGGLIIKEAIVKLTEKMDDEDVSILNYVSGFLFFGVPHQGMAIESLIPLVGTNPNRGLLESLNKNSALLQRLQVDFNNAIAVRRPRVIAFYETESSPTAEEKDGEWALTGPRKILVDVSSATCGIKNQHPINRTHSGIVKFRNYHDELYTRVTTALRPLVGRQGNFILHTRQAPDSVLAPLSEEQEECLRSLAFREQESRYHEIHSAEHTCAWLLEDSRYQAWMNQSSGLIWIKGNPGTGKSVLMKFAATIMDSSKSGEIVVSFFYHGRGTLLQKKPLGAYRALLNSMLASFPENLSQLTEKFRDRERRFGSYKMNRWQWAEKELQEALSEVLIKRTKNRPVVIFVDALDECGEYHAKALLEYFKNLMRDIQREDAKVKICFSSRHYPILGFYTLPTISVQDQNHKDIRLVIHERLKAINSDAKRQKIEKDILLKAQGGFQWAILVTNMVIERHERGVKAENLYKSLAEIPETLDELYTNILSGAAEAEQKDMAKLFQWVLFSERPLSAQELREALATDKDMSCTIISELRSHENWADTLAEFEKRVQHLSRGLVEFCDREIWEQYELGGEPWDREAQFVHQSAADYVLEKFLNRKEHCYGTSDSQIGAGHFEISRSCLRYITLRDVLAASQLPRGNLSAKFPLAPYAVRFLFHHIQKVEREGIPQPDLLPLIQWETQLGSLEKLASLWRVLDPHSVHTPMGWPFIKATPLHVLAAFGSTSAVIEFLQKDDVVVNGRDLDGNTPLLLAMRECHTDLALALLNWSMEWQARRQEAIKQNINQCENIGEQTRYYVDVNTENDDGDTPLTIALMENADEIIFKLIAAGANINSKDCYGRVPLSRAAQNGNEAVVKFLLERGADIESKDDSGQTPLLLAAENGNEAVVKLLLESGADIESKNNNSQTPLLGAAENGHEAVVKLLLERGADIWSKNDSSQTPLLLAMARRRYSGPPGMGMRLLSSYCLRVALI